MRRGWGSKIRTYEMTGSEPVALPLGYTPIFLDMFNWLDIWLDVLQISTFDKTSNPYISSIS